MGFPGVCVLEAKERRINTRQLRGNKLALLIRADFTMLKKKTELTWLSRASFCQLEHMIVSSQRRTQRKRRTKWSKISKNLCVNKHRSLLIWTCSFMAPRGGALSGHHPNTPLFTHTEAKSLWSHEARVWDPWQQRTGTERPSTPNPPQTGWMGERLWGVGLFQALVQPRSGASGHEGTDYFDVLKDIVKNCNMGQLWLFKKTSFQCRFVWCCIRSIWIERFQYQMCFNQLCPSEKHESEDSLTESWFLIGWFEPESRTKPFTQRASLHVSRAPLHARVLSHVLPEEDQEHLDMFWGGL